MKLILFLVAVAALYGMFITPLHWVGALFAFVAFFAGGLFGVMCDIDDGPALLALWPVVLGFFGIIYHLGAAVGLI